MQVLFLLIFSVIIIGLYIFSMNSSLLPLTNPLVVYATFALVPEHMSEMNHDSSNKTTSEDKKRFWENGDDIPNSNLYVSEIHSLFAL